MRKKRNAEDRCTIVCPVYLNIYPRQDVGISDSVKESYMFLDSLQRMVLLERRYVHLDLSECKDITAAALLLLYSEIIRCQYVNELDYPNQAITITWPTAPKACYVIEVTGFKKAIMYGKKRLERSWNDESIKFYCGNNPSSEMRKLESLLKKSLKQASLPSNIMRAISEAFLNILHHAYQIGEGEELHEFMINRWWMLTYVSEEEGERLITFIIYDKGAGIPFNVRKVCPGWMSDSNAIKKAFEDHFTSLGDPTRGLGTVDMRRPLVEHGDGLLVYSGRGVVYFDQNNIDGEMLIDSRIYRVAGTLLEWELRL